MYPNLEAEIARYQAQTGKTKQEIASEIGMSANSLRWKLNGSRQFMFREIVNLADLFSCSTDYLAGRAK